jgi:hypothetical protein
MSSWDNETPPKDTRIIPEGWRGFEIITGDDNPSKKGNPMFTIQLKDEQTGIIVKAYLIRTPGKRWNLKQVLDAAGIEKQDDDNYNYLPELIGKKVMVEIIHEPNEWIDRNGNAVTTTQHRTNLFKAYTSNPDGTTQASDIAFEE